MSGDWLVKRIFWIYVAVVACGFLINLPWQLYVLAAAVYFTGRLLHPRTAQEKRA